VGNFPYLMLIVLELGHFIRHFIDTLSLGLFGKISKFLGFFFLFQNFVKKHIGD